MKRFATQKEAEQQADLQSRHPLSVTAVVFLPGASEDPYATMCGYESADFTCDLLSVWAEGYKTIDAGERNDLVRKAFAQKSLIDQGDRP